MKICYMILIASFLSPIVSFYLSAETSCSTILSAVDDQRKIEREMCVDPHSLIFTKVNYNKN